MRRIASLFIVIICMLYALFFENTASIFPDAKSTMSFGFLLLTAYLTGDLLSRFKFPKITGYILAGIILGPFLFELIDRRTVQELKLIDDLALTFIALAAGGELRLDDLRRRKKSIILTTLFLTVIVFGGVAGSTMLASPWISFLQGRPAGHVLAMAMILGTLAVARSPSSAIAIISECRSKGPFTEMVLGVTVVMDVLVIIIFAVVLSICQVLTTHGTAFDVYLIIEITGKLGASILAGLTLGWIISIYIEYVKAELPVFILALAFLVTFLSKQLTHSLEQFYGLSFHLEPMLICMTAGFQVRNFSRSGNVFMEKINNSSLPIYVIFFSLTGAALDLHVLGNIWMIAIILVLSRSIFIWIGAYVGSVLSGDPPGFRRMSGLSFITQAGVSLGLAGIVVRRFPEWGHILGAVIVAIISINQIIGPVTFKMALMRVGEANLRR